MANMSYCRFQNTSSDFFDCVDYLEDRRYGDSESLSDDELRAAKRMTNDVLKFLELLSDSTNMCLDEFVEKCSNDPDAVDQVWDKLNGDKSCDNS